MLGARTTPRTTYTAANHAALTTILNDDATYPKTNAILRITGDCNGADITLSAKLWPGFRIVSGMSRPPLMARIFFDACIGAICAPIVLENLDFYNVYGGVPATITSGQVNFQTGVSRFIQVLNCKLHDDPLSTKQLRININCYRGFACPNNGRAQYVLLHGNEIFNVQRSVLDCDDICVHRNVWHDHYIHAATITGDRFTTFFNRGYNLWANGTDPGNPHSAVGFSPGPNPAKDTEDNLMVGDVFIPGTARFDFDGVYPSASGLKYNDRIATGRNVRIIIRNVTYVVFDPQAFELDAPTDCLVENSTFVSDEATGSGNLANFYLNDPQDCIIRSNIAGSISIGVDGRGSGNSFYRNFIALSYVRGTLPAYDTNFNGPTWESFEYPEDAVIAFQINPASFINAWAVIPGAQAYAYDAVPDNPIPITTNTTAITPSPVTKPSDAWLRTAASNAAWKPTTARAGCIIGMASVDATADAVTKNILALASSAGQMTKLNSGGDYNVRMTANSGGTLLDVSSTFTFRTADGMVPFVLTWDTEQARVLFARGGSEIMTDWPNIADFNNEDWIIFTTGRTMTAWADAITTPSSASWVGDVDTLFAHGEFLDIETDAGLSKVFATTGDLADLGANGELVFGTPPDIFLRGNAATYNGGAFNLGSGVGTGGGPTLFNKGGTSPFT